LHIIQAGESLLAIANRYGVSVAELQDANGILDPRTLQIGQSLIIPRPEEQEDSTLSAQTPTPTPLPIVVENVYLSDAGIGGLFILGEIANTSNTPLEHVRVGVTLLDANGKALSSADSLVALDLVDVGARAPFAILFGETLENYSNYQIAVLRAEPAFLSNYYRDLEIRNLTQKNEGYASYSISGQIANIGPEETQAVQVILTGYDSLGRVIATRKISPEFSVIPQGSATEFSAILAPVGGPLVRIEAIAQGRRKQ
jgi:LysM repeat protein